MSQVKLYYEDVKEGDEGPEVSLEVARTHIVKYAGAGGDFNPVHTDEAFAKAIGLPSVFAMGLMQAGYLARMLTDWLGAGNLRRYQVRFTGQVWPGETIICKGAIRSKYESDGEKLVDCELVVVNQNGESKIAGVATAALPTRG